jgi:hypothetical protein
VLVGVSQEKCLTGFKSSVRHLAHTNQYRQTQEQCIMPIKTVEVTAPVKDGDIGPLRGKTYNDAEIEIKVRQLTNGERGLLNPEKYTASQRQDHIEAYKAYNKTTSQLADMSREQGYLNSPAHVAWSLAAKERCGGAIDAATWRKMDPFGGTAGNGPEILPTGKYPGGLSTISMAHDTDWSLGRYFNAGPMKALHTSNESPLQMGMYGLQNHSTVRPKVDDLYTTGGHADWEVNYYKGKGVRLGAAEAGEASLVAVTKDVPGINKTNDGNVLLASAKAGTLEDSAHPYNKQFTAALNNLESLGVAGDKKDMAATLVQAGANAGFDKDASVKVVAGTKDNMVAVQGDGPTSLLASVAHSEVKQGAFQNVSESLAKQPGMQVAALPVEQLDQNKTRTM